MDISKVFFSEGFRGLFFGLLVSGGGVPAWADDVGIRAEFNAASPGKRFEITSLSSGFCRDFPSICNGRHLNTAQVDIAFRSQFVVPAWIKNVVQFRIPGAKTFEVRSRNGSSGFPVTLRITGVGSRYNTGPSTVMELTGKGTPREGHEALWKGGSFLNVDAPCKSLYNGHLDMASLPKQYRYFWTGPPGAVCGKTLTTSFMGLRNEFLDFSYELDTPNPYAMPEGDYQGTVTYSTHWGGDFDPGTHLRFGATDFSVRVVLSVYHMVRAVLLEGNKAQLEPAGGWQAWIDKGRPPTRLYRDLRFSQEASTPFTMKLRCGAVVLKGCALKSAAGDLVEVMTSVSQGLQFGDETGGRIFREPLSHWKSSKKIQKLQEGSGLSTLHFDIPADKAAKMKSGTTYSGTITVLWDVAV